MTLDGSLILESPDYFFRVHEIGRLHQTRPAMHTLLIVIMVHVIVGLPGSVRSNCFL